ncbi:MAG: hypothetical protein ABII96_11280 [Candidatus Zixiibacteriota bacterium]
MRNLKMALITGIVILLSLLGFVRIPETKAQSKQVLDLSKNRLRDRIQSCGFITAKPLASFGFIAGSRDAAVSLSAGEVVYLMLEPGKEVKAGDRFSVAQLGRVITHPVTKKKIGQLVLLPGNLTILERKDNMATAKIDKSFQSINLGDLIIPPSVALPEEMPIREIKKIEGIVVSSPEEEVNIAAGEFLFIDRGRNDGVIVGDLFSFYQTGTYSDRVQKDEKVKLPQTKVGEAVVVSVQDETSTAVVTLSSQPILVGDRAMSGRD